MDKMTTVTDKIQSLRPCAGSVWRKTKERGPMTPGRDQKDVRGQEDKEESVELDRLLLQAIELLDRARHLDYAESPGHSVSPVYRKLVDAGWSVSEAREILRKRKTRRGEETPEDHRQSCACSVCEGTALQKRDEEDRG